MTTTQISPAQRLIQRGLLASLLLLGATMAAAADVAGAQDHPLISRFPGTEIVSYYQKEYHEVRLPDRAAKAGQAPTSFIEAAGRHTAIVYRAPAGKTTAELMRNFRDAISAGKGTLLFSCQGGQCDGTSTWYDAHFFKTIFSSSHKGGAGPDGHYHPLDAYNADQRYLLAKLDNAEGGRSVVEIGMVSKGDGPVHISLEVIDEEAVRSGQITLNMDALVKQMAADGRVPFYGIRFDTGAATLRPESRDELTLLTSYLRQHPGVRVYVVGHTDDTGSFKTNLRLSQDRARAVTAYLTQQGIAAARLQADGVASLAPVSTQRTEAGRQLNRRVEIVERLP